MKVAVYTIVKNEEQHIERWAESAKEADVRLILDTGSDDRTVEIARSLGVDVACAKIDPWRFDKARNFALSLIPDDIDYCITLDADEVLAPGWRGALEEVAEEGLTRVQYKYVWSWNDDGSEGVVFGGERIHARHGYYWKHPVHEIIVSDLPERVGWSSVEIHHFPDPSKSRGQYLELLELAAEESPEDDRVSHYLAREYMFWGEMDKAARQFLSHLALPSARWKPERAASMRYLARSIPQEAEQWLLRACAEAPERRESWVELAELYYEHELWAQCYASSTRALYITEKPMDYICESSAWSSLPHDLASISAWNLGLKEEAKKYGQQAAEMSPDDLRLQQNLEFYKMTA